MKAHNLALVVLLALGVTACGSHKSSTHKQPEVQKELEKGQEKPEEKNLYAEGHASAAEIFHIPANKPAFDQVTKVTDWSESTDSSNFITIDGQQVQITEHVGENFWRKFEDKKTGYESQINTTKNTYTARVAKEADIKLDEKLVHLEAAHFVVRGINPTKEMPTSGTATYEGYAFHAYHNPYIDSKEGINWQEGGSAKFTVDFGKKTLEGKITVSESNRADLKATISGNYFEGTSDGYYTKGGFYGDKASELAGSYVNKDAQTFGVFNAAQKAENKDNQ